VKKNLEESIDIDNSAPAKIFGIPVLIVGVALAIFGTYIGSTATIIVGALIIVTGAIAVASLRVAGQYETAVVLRLGALRSIHSGQIFAIFPFVDDIIDFVDNRIRSSRFNAEQVLTKDTVPVNADAILFWVVVDAKKATLEVSNYERMILQAAQASLRDIIGRSNLSNVLSDSDELAKNLQQKIAELTHEWGVDLKSVELRDVQIPVGLQEAMSKEAQAEREKKARVILSQAEGEIAENFKKAAEIYQGTPGATELRAMNLLYESMKTGSNTIVIPTAAANEMGLERIVGIAKAVLDTSDPRTLPEVRED
jgi:regulator of protease activity HflC (stomatin/prohibitin superfamily)